MPTKIYDRKTQTLYTEKQYKPGQLRFLYGTGPGLWLANHLVSRPWVSRLAAFSYTRPASVAKILPFVRRYRIDMRDYPQKNYTSFNDFFTRKINPASRPVCRASHTLIAPADAKLCAYPINEDMRVHIKGVNYTLAGLLAGAGFLAGAYQGGDCLVFRLTVEDYHRFCYPDDGHIALSWNRAGRLHTVGPWADGKVAVLAQNQRTGALLATRHFGPVVHIDVGALLIGRVVVHPAKTFTRGQERGYFAYGGSTIVQLFRPGVLQLHSDIRKYSANGVETRVRMGEAIGAKAKPAPGQG